MEQRNLIPVALAVLAAGGTLWWVSTRPEVDPLEVGAASPTTTSAPARGTNPPPPPVPMPKEELARLVDAARNAPAGAARETAVHAIALKGRSAVAAVPELIRMLETEQDAGLRRKLAWSLGQLQGPKAAEALAQLAQTDSDASVRRQAADELGGFAPPPVDQVLASLDAERENGVRTAWIRMLRGRTDETVQHRLIPIARDGGSPEVRAAAIEAVGDSATQPDTPLWDLLADRAKNDVALPVRGAAAAALLETGHPDARVLVRQLMDAERDERSQALLRDLLDRQRPGSTERR